MGYQPIQGWTEDPQDGSGWQHTHLQQPMYSQQFMPIPYQEPSNNPMMIPQEYIPIHHQSHHQALTQITHATQHPMPIMATQAFVAPPKDNNYYGRGYSRPPTTSSRYMNLN